MRTFYSNTLHSGGHELGSVPEDYMKGVYDTLKDIDSVNGCSFDEWIDSFIKAGDLVEKEPVDIWKWIPIEEGLPDDDWDVLISGRMADGVPLVCMGEYIAEQESWYCQAPNCYHVDAWMEMPCSYKKEDL